MILTIFKEDVIEGLQKAASIIPQKTGAAYLRSIWLKAQGGVLEILSTDSNIEFRGSYTADIQTEGLVGVQGRAFVDLLRRLPNGKITLEIDEKNAVLHIMQGRRNYKLPTNDVNWFQTFSDFPEEGAVMWSGDFLQELIDRIGFCIGDDGMDAISCLIIKPHEEGKIEAAGMNGHQFAMMGFANDDLRALLPESGILLQKKYLTELKKWLGVDEIDINIDGSRVYLRTQDKKESLSVPLSSYQYPDYTVFLSRLSGDGLSRLALARTEAQEALNRIAIFNNENNRCAYFSLSEKEILLTTSGQDTGSAAENIDVEYEGNLDKIAFHTNNLLGILDHFTSEKLTLTFTGSEGPCGITGQDDPDYKVIIMPMKILEDMQFSEEQV